MFQEWCRNIWYEKEERLARFYKTKSFTAAADFADGDHDKNENNNTPTDVPATSKPVQWLLLATMILWTALVVFSILLLHWSSIARWLAIGHCIFFSCMTYKGGFELFQAQTCLSQMAGKEGKRDEWCVVRRWRLSETIIHTRMKSWRIQ